MGKEKIRNERELGELERGVRKERKEGRKEKKERFRERRKWV